MQSQLKGKDSPDSIATCVFTLSPLFFPPGDGFLLRRRAPLAAPGRGAPGGLRLLGPVPPAQLPHAVPPAGGRLGRGESRRWAAGGGPRAWGGLPAAGSPRNPPGPVHLQLCLGRAQEVAVRRRRDGVWGESERGGEGVFFGAQPRTRTMKQIQRWRVGRCWERSGIRLDWDLKNLARGESRSDIEPYLCILFL